MQVQKGLALPDNLALEDLSPEYREIAELIGLDNFILLIENYPGCQIYIPKLDGLKADSRNEQIRADFNGYNYKELALRYKLSERHVRMILSPVVNKVRARPMDGQVSMFEASD